MSLWCCFFCALLLFLLRWGNFLVLGFLYLCFLLLLLRSCWRCLFLFVLACWSLSFFQILKLRSFLFLRSGITSWSFRVYFFNWFWGLNDHRYFLLGLSLLSLVSLYITVTFTCFIIQRVFSLSLLSLFLCKNNSLSCDGFPLVITMSTSSCQVLDRCILSWCSSNNWGSLSFLSLFLLLFVLFLLGCTQCLRCLFLVNCDSEVLCNLNWRWG